MPMTERAAMAHLAAVSVAMLPHVLRPEPSVGEAFEGIEFEIG